MTRRTLVLLHLCLFLSPLKAQADSLPPTVSIATPSASALLPSTGGVFSGTATDGDGVSGVRVYVYDGTRATYTVRNAAASYTPLSGAWSLTIQASEISPGGIARLWVQAFDSVGNASAWQWREVQVASAPLPQDSQPPVVVITAPQNVASLGGAGLVVEGTATDAGGIAEVRVYVFDEVLGSFTVNSAPATITADAWSLTVPPSQVSPGGFARVWVQAVDAAGNASDWQLRRVEIKATPETLGPSVVTVQGKIVTVARRQPDGSLAPAIPWKLLGVNYSPVDPGDTVDTLAAARAHLRNGRYAEDFPMIRQLGANTIRTYADVGTDGVATQILNAAYEQGLMVMVTLADLSPSAIQATVNAYKTHPALLGWIIGNEWNLNLFFDPGRLPTPLAAAAAVEAAAQQVRSLDAAHPVASSLGFSGSDYNLGPRIAQTVVPSLMRAAPSVQLWGFNVYRAGSLDPFFVEWATLAAAVPFGGPYFLSEFGTDGWNQATGRLDDSLQANTDAILWDELHRQLSASHAARSCLGGFVMEWNDEWWKAGAPAVQDAGGFPLAHTLLHPVTQLPLATFLGHPDGFSNEEHYGLVTVARQPKYAFVAMQQAFGLGILRSNTATLQVTSVGNGAGGSALFAKNGLPFFAETGAGFSLAVMDRATGTMSSIGRFDTAASPLTQCPALRSAVMALTPGDVAMVGVAQSALGSSVTMTASSMAPCLDALQRLGAQRALSIGFQKPWALVAVAGAIPTNLAEGSGTAVTEVVPLSATVPLDADRDGMVDLLDADDDNDGRSDFAEEAAGTDVLDATSY